ncbi:uncharacterized protein LOC112088412 [Eutrema salsugineum]|uniref:uncharacterized protein LOC112088412 n=1 Tax=Eutrema salsugineum TaxID=72664 RepID=UPI000CECE61B|nr:uncharacterized protein LOC112088412 [Eutrema salsugineum]
MSMEMGPSEQGDTTEEVIKDSGEVTVEKGAKVSEVALSEEPEEGEITVGSAVDLKNTFDGEMVLGDKNPKVDKTEVKTVSWASVVRTRTEMVHYDLTVEEIDGIPTTTLPGNALKDSPLWADFLVGKFLSTAPFVGKIHALVNRIWTWGDKTVKIDVYVVDSTTVRFRIKDQNVKARVLRRGMWNLCDVPMVVTKWSPIAEKEQPEMTSIPLWVVVKKVPPHLYSWLGLSALTSPLGTPKKLHPDTEACKNLEEAKVFVEVNLTKALPTCFRFKSETGPDFVVDYVFPWLPPFCEGCNKWGHLSKECVSRKQDGVVRAEHKDTYVEVVSQDKVNFPVSKELGCGTVTGTSGSQNRETENPKQTDDAMGWITPSKPSKSPVKKAELKFGEVSILSNSRFEILSNKGDNGEEIGELITQGEDISSMEEIGHVAKPEQKLEVETERAAPTIPEVGQATKRGPKDSGGGVLRLPLPRSSKNSHKFISNSSTANAKEVNPSARGSHRKKLWEDLRAHRDSLLFRGKAWMISGDFNEILKAEEHSLYDVSPSIPLGIRDFQEMVNHCELIDLTHQGPLYTWCNKRREGLICKKLDRILVNQEWCSKYDRSYSVFEPGGCSDHLRCRFYIKEPSGRITKPFKYSNAIASHPDFLKVVKELWDSTSPLYHSTSATYRMTKKLKLMKPYMRKMGRDLLADISKRTKAAYTLLCELQSKTMLNPTSTAVDEEVTALASWNRLADIEEKFLCQKAKLH